MQGVLQVKHVVVLFNRSTGQFFLQAWVVQRKPLGTPNVQFLDTTVS